jgi:hypothetical protein
MKWLIAVLVAIGAAAAAGVVFRWRNPKGASSAWTHAADATSSMAKTAADKAVSAATAVTDELKGAVPH